MEKKITEWLNMLPAEIKEKALKYNIMLENETASDLEDALSCAFLWYTKPEGFDYWNTIATRAAEGEFNTK